MQVMALIKMSEQLGPPPPELGAAMEAAFEELEATATAVLIGGLLPSGVSGALIRPSGGRTAVLDGPFTEAKEVVGGFAILEVETFAQAVEATRKVVQVNIDHWPGWSGSAEVRQLMG